MASGKRCFLEAEDWQSIPDGLIEFPLLPELPELHHQIFGFFAAIPGLLGMVKHVTINSSENSRIAVVSRVCALQQDLKLWYQHYTSLDNGIRKPRLIKTPPFADNLFSSN